MSFFRRLKMPPVPTLAGQKWESSGRAIEDYFRKLRDALSAWDPDASPVIVGTTTVDGAVTLGDTSTIEATQNSDGTGVTLDVVEDSITNQLLSPMTANTVKANATATTANPTDVSVGTNTVLGRVAGDIVAAQLATGQVANDAITYAKIQNVSAASRVLVRGSAGGAGDMEEGTLASGLSLVGTALTSVPVVLRPAQITANQNDYSPGTFAPDRTTVFVSTDASRNITGILATGLADGLEVWWINSGTQPVVLQHTNAGSAAANRLVCPGAVDLTLATTEAAILKRDTTAAIWRVYKA